MAIKGMPFVFADLKDGDDVVVIDLRRRAGLAQKAFAGLASLWHCAAA